MSGCASVNKVESGARMVGPRMNMTIDGPWNWLDFPWLKPAQVWTMEGIYVDEMLVYSGVKDGELIHQKSGDSKQKDFAFKSDMQTEQLIAMFEGMMTRDGSSFKLKKVEPFQFGGKPGFRFEFERVRKKDNVPLLGVAYGAIDKGELFAIVYQAPRLTFFAKQKDRVEAIARSVKFTS
jgi:hypothetical protein